MTPEERVQLVRFLQLLEQANAGPKDEAAEGMIRDSLTRQPDAAYLLVQRVLQLEMAQQSRQEEIEHLKRQLGGARTSGLPASFFGQNSWGRQPASAPASSALPAASSLSPAAAQAQAQPTRSAWGSGLLGTVASTAVGVVAGSMLAQGIGSLLGNRNAAPNDAGGGNIPPGGGTLVETDYGAQSPRSDAGDSSNNYASGDSGDHGDHSDVG